MKRAKIDMLRKIAGIVLALVSIPVASQAQDVRECSVIARLGDAKPIVSDANECRQKTAPASTFKLPHALIALETNVIAADTVVPWNGTAYDFESWRRDHTLESAIRSSVFPFFERTARLIGPDRFRKGLSSLGYASDTFDRDVSAFWINGDLVVSPIEQLEFLQRLFSGNLPVASRHLSTVTSAIRMPAGQVLSASGAHPFELNWPSATVVRAKTGNTRVEGESVSWLVGALELDGMHYVFVARARSMSALGRTAGIAVAVRALNGMRPF
jgi:beta-lactamase class D